MKRIRIQFDETTIKRICAGIDKKKLQNQAFAPALLRLLIRSGMQHPDAAGLLFLEACDTCHPLALAMLDLYDKDQKFFDVNIIQPKKPGRLNALDKYMMNTNNEDSDLLFIDRLIKFLSVETINADGHVMIDGSVKTLTTFQFAIVQNCWPVVRRLLNYAADDTSGINIALCLKTDCIWQKCTRKESIKNFLQYWQSDEALECRSLFIAKCDRIRIYREQLLPTIKLALVHHIAIYDIVKIIGSYSPCCTIFSPHAFHYSNDDYHKYLQ